MRWFRHQFLIREPEDVAFFSEMLSNKKLGLECFGVYYLLMELLAEHMPKKSQNIVLTHMVIFSKMGKHPTYLARFFSFFEKRLYKTHRNVGKTIIFKDCNISDLIGRGKSTVPQAAIAKTQSGPKKRVRGEESKKRVKEETNTTFNLNQNSDDPILEDIRKTLGKEPTPELVEAVKRSGNVIVSCNASGNEKVISTDISKCSHDPVLDDLLGKLGLPSDVKSWYLGDGENRGIEAHFLARWIDKFDERILGEKLESIYQYYKGNPKVDKQAKMASWLSSIPPSKRGKDMPFTPEQLAILAEEDRKGEEESRRLNGDPALLLAWILEPPKNQ